MNGDSSIWPSMVWISLQILKAGSQLLTPCSFPAERRAAHTLGSWRTRLTIAVQSARALAYLHDEASPPVIHRDFTSSNVLLDGDWTAVVSDFGLAKLLPQAGVPNATQSTRLHGTLGYLAPE